MSNPVYALNLFDVADKAEYLAYARRSAAAVEAHGGRVMILVEWESKEAFDGYRDDPALADLHPHRVAGTARYPTRCGSTG